MSATWSKEEALARLDSLIEETAGLSGMAFSEGHTAWLLRTTDFLAEVFGQDSSYFGNFKNVPWGSTPSTVVDALDIEAEMERVRREAFQRQLGTARGVLQAARDKLEQTDDIEALYEGKDTVPEASLLIRSINLAEHKLRKVIREAPSDEKTVQDAFENLLVGADVEYSREAERIEYSSKTYVPDFTVDKAGLAIEMKVCLNAAREKALPAEINDDILAYKRKYPNMLFVVYDTGNIRDVDRFTSHFEGETGVVVRVVKH